jgi:hypothetical protein
MKNFAYSYFRAKYYYLVLIPIALLLFPNRGITHDARLYVFDILNIVHDGIFANDLVASAGTQHNYTLYSYIAAPLYEVLSPWTATSIVFIVGQLLWFSGIIALIAKFADDEKTAFFGLLSAFLLPTTYFGFSVLSYGETFATPRLIVEGLTFWSLWCFFNRAYLISALLVLVAFSLHPIMGLIAAALIIATLLQEERRWWWIFGAASVAGAVIVVASGVIPLDRITAALDGDWLNVVETRAKYLFISEWPTKDWARILLSISFTLPMIALYTGWQRRLVLSALIVGGAGLLVSFVGTDILHNVLLSQVQTSRAIWFAYLMGNVGMGVVVANLYRRSDEDGDAFFFLYIAAWTIGHILWPVPGAILGVAASSLAYLRITGRIAGLPSLFRRLIYMLSIILFLFLIFFRLKFWLKSYNLDAAFQDVGAFMGVTGLSQLEVLVVAVIIFAIVRLRLQISPLVTTALIVLMTVWAVFVWDRRDAESRGLAGDYQAETLIEHIPQGAQVYWEGNVKGAWYLLGRASYFALEQGAGVVFSRDLAIEYLRRSKTIETVDGVDYADVWRPGETNAQTRTRYRVDKELVRGDLAAACRSETELDFLLLTRRVDGAYITVWHPRTSAQSAGAPTPTAADLLPTNPYFLYRCADFR